MNKVEEMVESIQIMGCYGCPYHVFEYEVNSHCDLANRYISVRSAVFPKWCPLKKKIRKIGNKIIKDLVGSIEL